MSLALGFFAQREGLRRKFVAGDGEGFVENGEVGEDNCANVGIGLVRDGEGAAQHGGQAALEFVGCGLVDRGVAKDDDLAR